jgi:hypothetical protein
VIAAPGIERSSSKRLYGAAQRGWRIAAASSALMLIGVAGAAPANAADSCPNAAYRTGQGADLPDCRAYELVSPADKAGGVVGFPTGAQGMASVGGMNAVAPDGQTASFFAYQPFGDARSGLLGSYRATRTAEGWKTNAWSPAPPPMEVAPAIYEKPLIIDSTDDLRTGYLETTLPFDPLIQRPFNPFSATNFYDVFKLADSDGTPEWQSRPNPDAPDAEAVTAHYAGRSADGSAVLFETPERLTPAAASQAGGASLYVRSGGVTTLVAAGGGPAVSDCGAVALDASRNGTTRRGAINADGSRIVFTAPDPAGSGDPSCSDTPQVYVRDNGTVVEASASQRTVPDADARAHFEDASADGSEIFFTSDAALTNDADPANDGMLYRYDVPSRRLTLLAPSGVRAVVAVSDDGDYVYYVAGTSVMLANGGQNDLVADLPGVNRYGQNEIEFWLFGRPPALATPDGRHLLFQTWTRLGSFEHPNASELYVYSTDDQGLTCVSCNSTGAAPIGDAQLTSDGDRGFWPVAPVLRSISNDGSRVVFETQDALVSRDGNSNWDVYEWDNGDVELISDGTQTRGSFLFNVDESGDEIFFATSSSLVPQDTDNGSQDIYVARVGGGFAAPPEPATPCIDNCQGDGNAPPTLPDADVNTLSERPVDPDDPDPRPTTIKLGSLSRTAKTKFSRTGAVTFSVKVSAASTVTAVAQAKQGKTTKTVGKTSKRATKAGTVKLTLKLSKQTRKRLTARGSKTVTVKVSATGADATKVVRLRLNGAKR